MPRKTRVPAQPDAPGDIWKTNLAADAADAADVNDDTLSGMEIPLYAISDAGNGDADDEMATALRPPHKRLWLRILLIVFAVLAVAAVAGFFTARWYYQDKAAPGVMFAGASVAGQNSEQLAATVKSAVENTKITVTDSQGNTVTASLKDLGVNVNQKQTVSALIAAKDSNPFVRSNPFSKQNVKLAATTDKLALSQYLTGKLIPNDSQAIASTIAYDQTSQKFTVTVGRGGQAPVTDNVVKAIDQALDTPGTTRTASITYTQTDMPISEAAATTAADQDPSQPRPARPFRRLRLPGGRLVRAARREVLVDGRRAPPLADLPDADHFQDHQQRRCHDIQDFGGNHRFVDRYDS